MQRSTQAQLCPPSSTGFQFAKSESLQNNPPPLSIKNVHVQKRQRFCTSSRFCNDSDNKRCCCCCCAAKRNHFLRLTLATFYLFRLLLFNWTGLCLLIILFHFFPPASVYSGLRLCFNAACASVLFESILEIKI